MNKTPLEFLILCSDCRGRIVSSGDLTELQIAEARIQDRFFSDEDTGLGWAYLPWAFGTIKDDLRECAKRGEYIQ